MAYNPYKKIEEVYNAKVAWGNATTDEERKKQSNIANNARKTLESYGYGDIANQVSASGADAAAVKKILKDWEKVSDPITGTYKTGVDNPAYNAEIKLASDNNQKLIEQQASDRGMMTDKYGKLENYIYDHNPYESEIGKSIMEGYTWKGAKASNNEIASGAASNSGNIDSFAAANASRQQLAFTNAGKQAVLNDFNTRIGNVQNILSNLGVYLQNQDAGMQRTINMQDNRAQNIFNNEQTALNNDVARKSEIASVTGYVPDEWVVSNNPYMNDDGTIKDKYKDIDFAAVMANARATNNTNLYNAAATARYYKIMGDYKNYGQYDDGNYIVPGLKQTEAARQFDKTMDYNYALINSDEKMNAANNQNTLDLVTLQNQSNVSGYSGVVTNSNGTYYNGVLVGDKNGKPELGYEKTLELYNDGDRSPLVTYAAMAYKISQDNAAGAGNNIQGSTGTTEKDDIYTTWNNAGIEFKDVSMAKPSDWLTKIESADIDDNGKYAIEQVYQIAANGDKALDINEDGEINSYELANFLITKSNDYNTNKPQLKKVFSYFGLDTRMLDYVNNDTLWGWNWKWGNGVKYNY